jgi:sporulation integral membrane protein YlbJ
MSAVKMRLPPVYVSVVLGAAALMVVIGVVQSPGEAFRASLSGFQIWWQQVFPGLIPPLVLAELLAASGLLHGLAVLAEPLTRAWLRLPGAAGWAVAIGWAAGMPAGARETARLRERGLISRKQTDTLLLVSHVPNPFLVVVIAGAGFLQDPALGWAAAAGIWGAAVITGAIWSRMFSDHPHETKMTPSRIHGNVFVRAMREASKARAADGRPLGRLLADAVTNAVSVLMSIGGLMMLASVVIRLLQLWIPGSDMWLAIPGLYEMHLGAYETVHSPFFEAAPAATAALMAAVLAWTGFSGLLQARAAFGSAGAFPWGRLMAGKLLQSALALLITLPLAKALSAGGVLSRASETLAVPGGPLIRETISAGGLPLAGWRHLPEIWLAGLACFGTFVLLTVLAALIRPKRRHPPDPPS